MSSVLGVATPSEPRREPELEQPSLFSYVRGAASPSKPHREPELEQPAGSLLHRQTTAGASAYDIAKRFRAVKSHQFHGADKFVQSQTPAPNPRTPTPEGIDSSSRTTAPHTPDASKFVQSQTPVPNPRTPTPEGIDSSSPTTAPHTPDASSSLNGIPDSHWEKMVSSLCSFFIMYSNFCRVISLDHMSLQGDMLDQRC